LVIKGDSVKLVPEKWDEERTAVDDYVHARVAAACIRPRNNLVEKMIGDKNLRLGARLKERC
jgi:hypothetical protein